MEGFTEEVRAFLHGSGRIFSERVSEDMVRFDENGRPFSVIAVPIHEKTPEEAAAKQRIVELIRRESPHAMILPEDRWRHSGDLFRKRLSAHLGIFQSVFARNCKVCRIPRPEADTFLKDVHSYGSARCRYAYGLFTEKDIQGFQAGSLIAAASFSNARRILVGDRSAASYEWIRYASLPGLRVSGGMGKILKAFLRDIRPGDVMSYADREWSEGGVYRRLGFVEEGLREPVLFSIDPVTWERKALRSGEAAAEGAYFFMNWGSVKYRLTCLPSESDQ